MITQVNLGHIVAELADVARELEARVALELDRAPLDKFPPQQRHGDGACANMKM